MINSKEAKQHQRWSIGVTCGHFNPKNASCGYDIEVTYVTEREIENGHSEKIFLYKGQERVFKFKVPDINRIERIDIDSWSEDKFAEFKMLVAKGDKIPTTESHLHSAPLGDVGISTKITAENVMFCID